MIYEKYYRFNLYEEFILPWIHNVAYFFFINLLCGTAWWNTNNTFSFPILVEPCIRDYLVEWLSSYFSFSLEQLLLFIGSLAKYKKRNLFQRTIYIIPPFCPFRDILFFALLIRFSSYLMFNYTYCSVLVP
jgi:hypothetical protein